MPCCISTTSASKPMLAMTSAEKLLGKPSQLFTTALPDAQISRTPFARAISILRYIPVEFASIPPAMRRGVKRRHRTSGGAAAGSSHAHDHRDTLGDHPPSLRRHPVAGGLHHLGLLAQQ